MPFPFFDRLKSLFFRADVPRCGLILDDPSVVETQPQFDLVFGGRKGYLRVAPKPSEKDWSPMMPPFRNQGASRMCTAYAGTDVASAFERAETGKTLMFSPLELFFRSYGLPMGNSLLNTAKAMENALVKEADLPTPVMSSWNYTVLKGLSHATQMELDEGKAYAMKSHAFVTPDPDSIREALKKSPIYAGIGVGSGYWNDPAPATWSFGDYHAVVITAMDNLGRYVIKDSLAPRAGFDGFHKLAADYPILSAMAFVDLPDDWQVRQEAAKKADYAFCLDHYGKRRDFTAEQKAANILSLECKAHPEAAAEIGRLFTAFINANVYGGYSVQDLLNHVYSIRRGKGPIWDLNQMR